MPRRLSVTKAYNATTNVSILITKEAHCDNNIDIYKNKYMCQDISKSVFNTIDYLDSIQ